MPFPVACYPKMSRPGNGGGASFVGPLDAFSADITGIWSPAQRLLTSYEGPLIRVRRDSDDTESDIGAAATGALDTAALTTFLAGAGGFLRYVYDQVGSNQLGNATTTEQPAINTAVTAWGETPAMVFAGVPNILSFGTAISPTSLLLGAHSTSSTGFGRYCSDAAGTSSFFEISTSSAFARYGNGDGQISILFADGAVGHGLEMWYDGLNSISRIDTAEEAAAATAPLANITVVGAYANNTQAMIGSIPYIVALDAFYNISDRAAVRAALASVFPFAT